MKRIQSLDLARGFTVLMIAPIHTMLLYSKMEVRETLLGNLLRLIAEWHGAQIFMVLMGISFSMSKKNDFKKTLERATILLAIAYALNIFKFVIPHYFGLLPDQLLNELQIQNGLFGFLQLFLIGDILHFDHDKKVYRVFVKEVAANKIKCFYSRHIIVGIGTAPNIPSFIQEQTNLFHSSDYLFHKGEILKKKSVTIVGSGQSAAEIFYDLLQHHNNFEKLNWFTRSKRFFPMDYSKFALEMTSPDYIDHFYSLDQNKKKEVLQKQNTLYKIIQIVGSDCCARGRPIVAYPEAMHCNEKSRSYF